MVDGIPLNLSRETSRGLSGIDPESIQNIEVIRGSNAIYGGGATGGIISITTKSAGGEPTAKTVVGFQTPLTNFSHDALSADIHQYFSGSLNDWDYALDFGYKRTGSSYDASGDRIAPEPSQGDLFDSDAYSIGVSWATILMITNIFSYQQITIPRIKIRNTLQIRVWRSYPLVMCLLKLLKV